jgi:STE24 endopeptidase
VTNLWLGIAILVGSLTAILRVLNLRHLGRYGNVIPPNFEGVIDHATLSRMSAYTLDSTKLALVADISSGVLTLVVLFGGVLEAYDGWIAQYSQAFIAQGVLYFVFASWALGFWSLPFSLYSNFVVEARHGFNRTSTRLFFSDFVKSMLLSSLLIAILATSALFLVKTAGSAWWITLWALFLIFELVLMLIAPTLIEPLFVKTTPLRIEELATEIRALANRASLRVDRVFQVDASRRSGHTNAYFTGIGPVKRVVLYDTLLERLTHAEILAVLAHELGHWKLRHILKRFVIFQCVAFATCYIGYRLISWEALPGIIGASRASFSMRVTLVMFLGSLVAFFLAPLISYGSRRHERQADSFACKLVESAALASGLVKLARDNLANLHPHPLYAAWYASHPAMPERVARLRALSTARPALRPSVR